MQKLVLAAMSATALIALSACAEADTTEDPAAAEGDTEVNVNLPEAPVEDGTAMENDGDRISISEDGIDAEINDGDTRVRADVDGNPSLEVETD